MKKTLLTWLTCFSWLVAQAQIVYLDVVHGNDRATGGLTDPVASLHRAVSIANGFSGQESITIRMAPGLYQLSDQVTIGTEQVPRNTATYSLEAMVLPDAKSWTPNAMPVIQSRSGNNNKKDFDHCTGLQVARANVHIRGLKFVGNANPSVAYYYPIEKDNASLPNLTISQCYFIGDHNGSPVQGGIYANGPNVHVDHCIFYGCKNAVLVFEKATGFSLTHCIIYGAYECAVWYGYHELAEPFTFSDNIVTHCRYV